MDFPTTSLQDKHRFRLLALLLSIFHLSIWYSITREFLVPLMLMHFGLFLFWQPIWSRKQEINPVIACIFSIFIGVALWFASLWFLMFWGALLIGLFGGSGANNKDRVVQGLAIMYLLVEMIIFLAPKLFMIDVFNEDTNNILLVIMFFIPAPLLFFSSRQEIYRAHHTDVFRGLVLSLVAMLLVVGGVLRFHQTNTLYLTSVFQIFLILGVSMLFVGWIWNPSVGYKGLFFVWNRYLLNVGTPIEDFLFDLTQAAQKNNDPAEF